MAKRKKTRKQKKIADMRHETRIEIAQTPSASLSIDIANGSIISPVKQIVRETISTSQYSYLYQDLRKTIFLTFLIIIAELIFRYFVFGAQ